MRTWMIVLLALSMIDFTLYKQSEKITLFRKRWGNTTFSLTINPNQINLTWLIRIAALILFLTNY